MTDKIKVHDLFFEKFITEERIRERVEDIGNMITAKYQGQCPVLLGILNGVYVFMADLSRACKIETEISFMKLSSYKGTSSSGEISTQLDLNISIQGKPVIIVEDIVDSGRTMHHLLPKLWEHHPSSIELVALLVKREAMEFPIEVHYAGFEIPSKFVVGYGLDYDGKGRNLSSIFQLSE